MSNEREAGEVIHLLVFAGLQGLWTCLKTVGVLEMEAEEELQVEKVRPMALVEVQELMVFVIYLAVGALLRLVVGVELVAGALK